MKLLAVHTENFVSTTQPDKRWQSVKEVTSAAGLVQAKCLIN